MLQTVERNSCLKKLMSGGKLHGESFPIAGCFANRLIFLLEVCPRGRHWDGDNNGGGRVNPTWDSLVYVKRSREPSLAARTSNRTKSCPRKRHLAFRGRHLAGTTRHMGSYDEKRVWEQHIWELLTNNRELYVLHLVFGVCEQSVLHVSPKHLTLLPPKTF